MNEIEPKYEEGTLIVNKITNERFRIRSVKYSKKLAAKVYVVQNYRYKFDMVEIAEPVIKCNIERGRFEVKQ